MVINISPIIQRNKKLKQEAAKLELKRCISEIGYVNKLTDSTFYVFTLPKCIFGVPYYDIQYTAEIITLYLKKQGYDVYQKDDQIIVNWHPGVSISSIVAEKIEEQLQKENEDEVKEMNEKIHSKSQTNSVASARPPLRQPTIEFLDALVNKKQV